MARELCGCEKGDRMKVCVVYGGWSREREVSIRSGKNVASALRRLGYEVYEVDMQRDIALKLHEINPDIVFPLLHGRPGEDGTFQGMLEIMGIPYVGSGVLASALAMDKIYSKKIFLASGVNTPFHVVPGPDLMKEAEEIPKRLGMPVVVKPACEGSSIGVKIVKTPEELYPAMVETRRNFGRFYVEEYIQGMTATVAVVGSRALPVLELVPKREFYDYEAKYTKGLTEFIVPARLSPEETRRAQEMALLAHNSLGCQDFSRVDMIIRLGEPYVLEVNTIPGMTDLSDLPAEANAEGKSYDEIVDEILKTAARRWGIL
ncbi:D-alanine--D-alanine ligase [bacterium]|nr:MAG: D-alanine--D-alanine ligase [bacterium]